LKEDNGRAARAALEVGLILLLVSWSKAALKLICVTFKLMITTLQNHKVSTFNILLSLCEQVEFFP